MPSYKVGARGEGTVSALLDYVQRRQERQQTQEDEQRKWHRRVQEIMLQREDVSDEFIRAMLGGQPTAGVPLRRPAAPIPPNLQASGYKDRLTGIDYSRSSKSVDASLLATRSASLLKTIQDIERANQLAPMLAQEQQEKAYPSPTGVFGGYIDQPPNLVGRLVGRQQRPPAPALTPTDVGPIRRQYEALMDAGVVTQEDLDDLTTAIQQGQITSQDQAVQVIEAAGLDPNDPAFQSILAQLR